MRSVRRGEAAYLELMREAKAQFDAEIAKNKEKGKAGRPRKEIAPIVVEDDDIEIDFSDVVSVHETDAIVEPAPAKAIEKKDARNPAPVRPKNAPAAKKAPVKKTPVKKAPAKKAPSKKAPAKKAAPKKK
jgi:hypothetical protein